jgi:hypothetical protein
LTYGKLHNKGSNLIKQINSIFSKLIPLYLYPFLYSFFIIIFFYTKNIEEVPVSDIFFPLGALLCATCILFLLFSLLFREPHKSALVVFILIFAFFSYGFLWDGLRFLLNDFLHLKNAAVLLIRHRYLLPGMILFCLIAIIYIAFVQKSLKKTTQFFFILVSFLLGLNAIIITTYFFSHHKLNDEIPTKSEFNKSVQLHPTLDYFPDIYYFTFDEFAGFKTIKMVYNYDPSSFHDFLIKSGFYIPQNSHSNYSSTPFSLASSANMEYVHFDKNMMKHSLIRDIFAKAGYQTIPTENENKFTNLIFNDFFMGLINNSIFKIFSIAIHRHSILNGLKTLESSFLIKGPKFVRYHIICPHAPFIFTANGSQTKLDDWNNWENKNLYLSQWIFISKQIEKCIESILTNSKQPPIIIIQSDHGERSVGNQPCRFATSYDILNAYFLPDKNYGIFYDSVSPVNSFRIIFNHYFKTNYKLLPDLCYLAKEHYKQFMNVTDSVRLYKLEDGICH